MRRNIKRGKIHYKVGEIEWCLNTYTSSNPDRKYSNDIKKITCKLCLSKYHINTPVFKGEHQHAAGVIYKITNPKGAIYIGQTVNFTGRMQYYRNMCTAAQKKLHNSLLKYGWHNHVFEIIEQCEEYMLNIRERFWQEYYNCICPKKGLNCILVETAFERREMSAETRAKISKARKGKKLPREVVAKIVAANKRTREDPNHVRKAISVEGRAKMRKASLKNESRHVNLKLGQNKGYPVLQFSVEGEFIKEWRNAQEAAVALKIDRSGISKVIRRKKDTCLGFVWEAKNPEDIKTVKYNYI